MSSSAEYDVAIIGAGAAGIGAAKAAAKRGLKFVVLEASHRIGGRAYTEEILPGVPLDLGCHWMHSASLNPFVKIAEELGFAYSKAGFERSAFVDGKWNAASDVSEWGQFHDEQFGRVERAAAGADDCSVYDVTERDHRFSPDFDYIMSLHTSFDPDEVSVKDLCAYNDTDEDWPVRDGYGALIAKFGSDVPVQLNTAVTKVDWSGPYVTLETAKGTATAQKVVITVSTGILAAGDIAFTPELPDWKREAVAGLPLGCHNRIALGFDRDVFGADMPPGGIVRIGDDEPLSVRFRPDGFPFVVGVTGGRFGDWLERAGQQAAVDFLSEKVKAVCGSDILKHAVADKATAWRGDPWVRGAYSAAQPGQAHQRAKLAEPVDECLYFAGEATSSEFYSTAHGAYLSGLAAAEHV